MLARLLQTLDHPLGSVDLAKVCFWHLPLAQQAQESHMQHEGLALCISNMLALRSCGGYQRNPSEHILTTLCFHHSDHPLGTERKAQMVKSPEQTLIHPLVGGCD